MAIKFNKVTLDAEMVLGDTGTFSIAPKIDNKTFLSDGDEIWFTLKKRKENFRFLYRFYYIYKYSSIPFNICSSYFSYH